MFKNAISKLKTKIEKIKRHLFPSQIVLDEFIPSGCKFECRTNAESYRARTYGDEKKFLRLFLKEINPKDIVFDIGSCIGIYTIHAAKKGAFVIAFEPEPNFYKRLKRNVKINDLGKRVDIQNWAVSNRSGTSKLFTDGIDGMSPTLIMAEERGYVDVKTDSLDNAMTTKTLKIPNIIKLDIEGAEMFALLGMENLLSSKNAPRAIFIEIHPEFLKSFNFSQEEVENLLSGHGYKMYYHEDRRNETHCIYKKE